MPEDAVAIKSHNQLPNKPVDRDLANAYGIVFDPTRKSAVLEFPAHRLRRVDDLR